MARGWESKSVEMQIEERKSAPVPEGGNTHADAGAEREREVLELSRKHLINELETIMNPRLREIKRRALAHLNRKIAEQAAR